MSEFTSITDINVPEILADQVSAKYIDKIPLIKSGVVGPCPFPGLIDKGGERIKIPKDVMDATAWQRVVEGTALVEKKMTTDVEYGVVVRRGDCHSTYGNAQIVSMADPLTRMSDNISNEIAKNLNLTLLMVLKGALGALGTSNTWDAIEDNEADDKNMFSADNLAEAQAKVGANFEDFQFILMHSRVAINAIKAGMVRYVQSSLADVMSYAGMLASLNPKMSQAVIKNLQSAGIPYIGSMQVLVDDNCPADVVDGKTEYTSYILGAGSMWIGYQKDVVIETERVAKSDINNIMYRLHFVPQLMGVGYAAASSMNPTDANLVDTTLWELTEVSSKSIRAVKIVTNG